MTARVEARIRAARRALTDQEKLVATLRIRLATAEARLPDMERELNDALAAPSMTNLGAHIFDLGCTLNRMGVARW